MTAPEPARRGRVRVPLYIQIIIGMVIGGIVGPLLGARAAPLGELGKLVIQLIKAVATPLLFFAIVNAILRTELKGRPASGCWGSPRSTPASR
jgi:Na+/H+-dicarboxylate symporter